MSKGSKRMKWIPTVEIFDEQDFIQTSPNPMVAADIPIPPLVLLEGFKREDAK